MKKKTYVLPLLALPLLLSTQAVLAQSNTNNTVATDTTHTNENNTAVSEDTSANTVENETANSDAPANDTATNDAATETAETTETTETPEVTDNSANKELVILHTNDIHGRLEEDKRGKVIGVAKLDSVVKAEKAKTTQTTVVVDAGDALQGLPISNSTKGEEMVKILNEIGYDAIAVGNHEFDFGFDQAVKYKELFSFPILSANTYVDNVRLFEAATVVDKDKTVIGDEVVVIGVTTPETYTKTHPKNIQNVEFKDPITEVKNVIAEMESKSRAIGKTYNTYIVLGHLGIDDTTKKEWQGSTMADELSKYELLNNKKVIVIDGHSHTAHTATYGKNVGYAQTGNYLNNIGKVTIDKDGNITPTLISYADTATIEPSANIAEKVAEIKANFVKENAVVILENNTVELNGDRKNVRVRETNLGNIVADSLYDYGQTGFSHPTDLAVTNGGGLRDTIRKDATVTKGDIIAVLPFGNTISQIEVKGSQIQDMFKHSLSATLQKDENGAPVLDENGLPLLEANGSFLHTSGVRVYYDTTIDAKDRVLRIEILNRATGEYDALDLNKTYYLATNDFLAAGGDGYTMLGGAREEGPSMDAVFAEYIKTAQLTNYSVINPNTRLIALPVAAFDKLMAERVVAQQDTQQSNSTDNMSSDKMTVDNKKAVKQNKKATKQQKQLPKTGSTNIVGLGAISIVFSMIMAKLKKKEVNE